MTLIAGGLFLAYTYYLYWDARNERMRLSSAVYRMAHESAQGGCAVFDNNRETNIIIMAQDPVSARKQIDRVANDLDNFAVAISSTPKRRTY